MKKRLYVLILLTFSIFSHCQKNYKDFFEVTIYKRVNIAEKEQDVIIKIDSLGNIFKNNSSTANKINLITFNKSIHKIVNLENSVEKVEGNNNPPRMSFKPKLGTQNFYLTVVFLKDYYNEINLSTQTNYSIRSEGINASKKNYSWFIYLSKKDLEIIKELLE